MILQILECDRSAAEHFMLWEARESIFAELFAGVSGIFQEGLLYSSKPPISV